jgi:hypothetical protein
MLSALITIYIRLKLNFPTCLGKFLAYFYVNTIIYYKFSCRQQVNWLNMLALWSIITGTQRQGFQTWSVTLRSFLQNPPSPSSGHLHSIAPRAAIAPPIASPAAAYVPQKNITIKSEDTFSQERPGIVSFSTTIIIALSPPSNGKNESPSVAKTFKFGTQDWGWHFPPRYMAKLLVKSETLLAARSTEMARSIWTAPWFGYSLCLKMHMNLVPCVTVERTWGHGRSTVLKRWVQLWAVSLLSRRRWHHRAGASEGERGFSLTRGPYPGCAVIQGPALWTSASWLGLASLCSLEIAQFGDPARR